MVTQTFFFCHFCHHELNLTFLPLLGFKTQCSWVINFCSDPCQTVYLPPCFLHSFVYVSEVSAAWWCFYLFSMPGDPAVFGDASATLTAADRLNALTVKLLSSWPDNIETWLVQSKSQFCLKGVTLSQIKFDYFLQSMSQGEDVKVLNLIWALPAEEPYKHHKDCLLKMYTLKVYTLLWSYIQPSPVWGYAALHPDVQDACPLACCPWALFLHGGFLKCLPADVWSQLVHNMISDPLSLALSTDKIYKSQVSSTSALNRVSYAPVFGAECPVLAVCASPASLSQAQCSPTPGPGHRRSSAPSSATRPSDSPSLCWYHRNHVDQTK